MIRDRAAVALIDLLITLLAGWAVYQWASWVDHGARHRDLARVWWELSRAGWQLSRAIAAMALAAELRYHQELAQC